jgi:hypothetical protein
MATTQQIGGNGLLFVGEDKQFALELLDVTGIPIDMTGMTFTFDVRTRDGAPPPAIFSKVGALTGVYNAVRLTNTQRMVVALSAIEMETVKAKIYRYSWKRLNASFYEVAARGNFTVEIATQY